MNKEQKYDWAKPGDRGRQCVVSVSELKIDHSYQRQPVSNRIILDIAASFSWSAFGSLIVMERISGDKFVVDGQQRLMAAKKRGDIDRVPCLLFASDGKDHEAQAFLTINTHRKGVTAVDRFVASARAGLEPAASVSKWLAGEGIDVAYRSNSATAIAFPDELVRTWSRDEQNTRIAFITQKSLNGNTPALAEIHKGVFYLLCQGIDIRDDIEKIKIAGGKVALREAIKTMQIELGHREANPKTCALGILSVINFKRRRKITLGYTE